MPPDGALPMLSEAVMEILVTSPLSSNVISMLSPTDISEIVSSCAALLGNATFGASPLGASPFGASPLGASPFGASPSGNSGGVELSELLSGIDIT